MSFTCARTALGTRLFCALAALFLPASPAWPEAAEDALSGASFSIFQKRPLRIGVITLGEMPDTTEFINATFEEIRRVFAPYPVIFEREVNTLRLEHMIREGTVDVFIASSGFYWRMVQYGVVNVATLITNRQPDPNNGVAATILVRSDNDTIRGIGDLKGKRLSASYRTAFMSFRTGLGEIAALGYDPEHFFGSIHWRGDTNNTLIASLLDRNEADAAMVRACWLEEQPPEVRARYRVVAERPEGTDPLFCVHSTRTYPNVMVSVTQGSAPGAAHLIAKTLSNMPARPLSGHRWGMATDWRSVNRLYRELKIENFAYLRDPTLGRWVEEHISWIFFGVLSVLFLIGHSWRVGYLVRLRTAELRKTMEEREAAQKKVNELHERMERMQKATIVGQLSNLIAHELSQPLAAIQYYTDGLRALLSNPSPSLRLFEMSCRGIEGGISRTRAIVDRVRHYAKHAPSRDAAIGLADVVEVVTRGMSLSLREGVAFSAEGLEGLAVQGDRLEMELLFNNVIRNAFEAAKDTSDEAPFVRVSGRARGELIEVDVENSGRKLTDEAFSQLIATPTISSKAAGLGLGIPIATALAEASRGRLEFERRPKGGITARITLRTAPATESSS